MTVEEIRELAGQVFAGLEPRVSAEDLARVKDAFEFALKAHDGQFRKGGDPYIVHPVNVAKIVAEELEMDANVVCAAFLHDVVEDTGYTLSDIRERFGDDVAFLVDVVTKKKTNKQSNSKSKQVENYKQILDSVHYNIRPLMVKLADRLHNMRTLDSMRPDKQMKIAGETDFFYAPLANRLGLFRVRSELENLSFRYRCPRDYAYLEAKLEEDRKETQESVDAFVEEIGSILAEKGLSVRIGVRYRKPYSIWRDMKRDNTDFSHIEFKHYIRVCYKPAPGWSEKDTSLFIYSVLTDKFKERPGSVANYIDTPKENGYQSFHFKLLSRSGCWEELHVSSERMLRNSRLGCIDKSNEETMNQWLDKLRALLEEVADQDMDDFMEGLSTSFYDEDVYALTPQGRVVILPKGASAIDFAYELHTDIGDHAQFARINGTLCSIKTVLQRGDCVEIGTNPEVHPEAGWLDHVKTYKARKCIRNHIKDEVVEEFVRCDRCDPLPGEDVVGFRMPDGRISLHLRNCPDAIKLASEQGDSIVATKFTGSPDVLYPVTIKIIAIDRRHLLRDILECITEAQNLSIITLQIACVDHIATFIMDFGVHSVDELSRALSGIAQIDGVDSVGRAEV